MLYCRSRVGQWTRLMVCFLCYQDQGFVRMDLWQRQAS
jgi:hypothetical protein